MAPAGGGHSKQMSKGAACHRLSSQLSVSHTIPSYCGYLALRAIRWLFALGTWMSFRTSWLMAAALMVVCAVVTTIDAQDAKKKSARRFGFEVDEETYSQQSPEKAMQAIVKALDRQKVD